MSAVQFQRQLGLTRYETAFGILHKLRAGMVRPDQGRIGGRAGEHVEVDEAYVGGRTRGEGRGVHHKTLVTAAVEVRHREPGTAQDKRKDGRYAGRVRLSIADDRSAKSLARFVESAVMPGTLVITDDWSGYASLRKRGLRPPRDCRMRRPGGGRGVPADLPSRLLDLKTWLNGIHHGVSAKHLQAYLNEFTFRFNRRFYPFNAFRSLLGVAGGVSHQPLQNSIRAIGCILHVVGMGVNRIHANNIIRKARRLYCSILSRIVPFQHAMLKTCPYTSRQELATSLHRLSRPLVDVFRAKLLGDQKGAKGLSNNTKAKGCDRQARHVQSSLLVNLRESPHFENGLISGLFGPHVQRMGSPKAPH